MRKVASDYPFCVLIYMNSYIFHINFMLLIFLSNTYLIFETAGKWWKCDPILEHRLQSSQLGRAMNLVDWLCTSVDERVLSGRRAVVICVMGCLRGWLFFIDPSFLVDSHFDHSRAWISACSLTAAAAPLLSLQSFYNYARGHCEAAQSFFRAMHSVHLISVEQ